MLRATLLFATLVASCVGGYAAPLLTDLWTLSEPSEPDNLTKRQINTVDYNRDANLKQISLQSLIGGLESSLFASAMSVQNVVNDKEAVIEEVTLPAEAAGHTLSKRQTVPSASISKDTGTASTEIPRMEKAPKEVIFLTTERVPEKDGVPQHIVIDRVSIVPHNGVVALLPAFQVQHTKLGTAVVKEPKDTSTDKQTAISNSKMVIQSTETIATTGTTTTTTTKTTAAPQSHNPAAQDTAVTSESPSNPKLETKETEATQNDRTTKGATTSMDIISSTSTTTPTTTITPISELKEAEKELKEKVAEIEADPVILSARV